MTSVVPACVHKDDFVLEDSSCSEDARKGSGGLRFANGRESSKETRATTEVGWSLPGAVLVRGPSFIATVEDDDDTSNNNPLTRSHPPLVEEMVGLDQAGTSSGPIHATLVSEDEEEADENQSHRPEPQLVEAQVLPIRTYAIVAAMVFLILIAVALAAVFLTRRKKSSYQIPTVTTASPSDQPTMAPTIDYGQRLERYDQVVAFMFKLVSLVTDQCQLVDNMGDNSNWLVTASCQDHGLPSDLYLAGHRPGMKCNRVDDSTVTCQLNAAATGNWVQDSIAFVCGATMGPDLNSTAIVFVEGLRLHSCNIRDIIAPAHFTMGIVTFCELDSDANVECSDSSLAMAEEDAITTYCTFNATNPCLDDTATGCSDDNDVSITFNDWARAVKVIHNETCSSPTWETNPLYPLVGLLRD